MQKQIEDLRRGYSEVWQYAEYLESQLDECSQYHHPNVDFRANRPPDHDVLLGQGDDSDVMMGGDDNDQGSDDGNDFKVMAICIPPQSLQVEPFNQPSRFPAVAENPDETYVLMVDGHHAQPSHYNPNLDWSRHLPSNVPLDRPTHDRALDLLFKFFTSWCLRIVPALFLRDMCRALGPSQTPPKTPHYSPMLHNALVALALSFADEPFNDIKTRQIYASVAKSFIEAECRKPNLSVVHALSVLSSYHSSQGDQTLGYMYFGMSARISQALGLNHDFSEWVKLGIMDEGDRLDRHWASWTNFSQDVCWSLYVGRDFCVAEPIGAPMPHIDPKYDEMTFFHPPSKIAPQPNNLTKTFEASCRLLMIARRIMDVINGLNKARSRALSLDNLINDIDARLNMWRDSLSEELEITTARMRQAATPHKLMLHLAYWWLVILLHRPFFYRKPRPIHSTDSEIVHAKICRQAAENIMELLSTWRNLYKLRYCPTTLIQTAFSAGTVYLLIAMQASSGTRVARKELRHSLDQATLMQQYLHEIGVSWNSATHISVTLRRLMDEQVRPNLDLMDRKNIPTTSDLHLSADVGDDEEENNSGLSRSSSSKRPSITKSAPPISQPHTMSTGPGQSSLSAPPHHIVTPAFPTRVPPPANPSISSTITPSTQAPHSAPITIPSQRSTTSSNPSEPWAFQPSPSSSPNVNYLPSSSTYPDRRKYSQPFSNSRDDLFSGSNSSSDDVDHGFESLVSFLANNFQRSPSTEFLGMLGGQTISETPFVGFLGGVEDNNSPNFVQTPSRTGFPNRESSSNSLGEHVPSSSHGGNDSMDLDNVPWRQSFAS